MKQNNINFGFIKERETIKCGLSIKEFNSWEFKPKYLENKWPDTLVKKGNFP